MNEGLMPEDPLALRFFRFVNLERGILAGLPLARAIPDDPTLSDALLVCATEVTTRDEIAAFAAALGEELAGAARCPPPEIASVPRSSNDPGPAAAEAKCRIRPRTPWTASRPVS